MSLKIADMLFGPSDALGFPICLFACDSHGFDTCLNERLIIKYFLQNKYLIALNQQIGVLYRWIYSRSHTADDTEGLNQMNNPDAPGGNESDRWLRAARSHVQRFYRRPQSLAQARRRNARA